MTLMKSITKEKASSFTREQRRTGGGSLPVAVTGIDGADGRILEIIGDVAINGITDGFDSTDFNFALKEDCEILMGRKRTEGHATSGAFKEDCDILMDEDSVVPCNNIHDDPVKAEAVGQKNKGEKRNVSLGLWSCKSRQLSE